MTVCLSVKVGINAGINGINAVNACKRKCKTDNTVASTPIT